MVCILLLQYCLDLRKPDLRKNLDLRKIVATTDFLVHKLFDLRKIFKGLMLDLKKGFFPKSGQNRDFLVILGQFLGFFISTFGLIFHTSIYISYIFFFSFKPVKIMNMKYFNILSIS